MCKGIILGRIRHKVEENLSRKYYVQTDPLLQIVCNIVMKIEKNLNTLPSFFNYYSLNTGHAVFQYSLFLILR